MLEILSFPLICQSMWFSWASLLVFFALKLFNFHVKRRMRQRHATNVASKYIKYMRRRESQVEQAWRRIMSSASAETTRLCPICMDADAVTVDGRLNGLSCANGHPFCYKCIGRVLDIYVSACDASGLSDIAHFTCPICRVVSYVPTGGLCTMINEMAMVHMV